MTKTRLDWGLGKGAFCINVAPQSLWMSVWQLFFSNFYVIVDCLVFSMHIIYFLIICTLLGDSKSYRTHLPVSVKIVVIVIPVLILLSVGIGVAFYCYRKSASGLRFPVHLTPAGNKVPMRRLSEEI